MKKISVIIPIYNLEKYLKKCIESVLSQKNCNIEIILVNDGSTDNSGKIAKEYETLYENVKYFEKENGGLSDARNYGLRYVTGDYICFIDSDDYISCDLFEKLEDYTKQDYDLIKYKVVLVDENEKEIKRIDGPIFTNKTGEEAFNILFSNDVMLQPACLYLYKSSFWREHGFRYPIGKKHEDFAVTLLIMLKAKKVCSINEYGYYYVQTQNSITRGNNEDNKFQKSMDIIEHYDNITKEIEQYDIKADTKINVRSYCANNVILEAGNLSGDKKKQYVKELKKRKVYKNIPVKNVKQLIKRILLKLNVNLYLKLR